jgi:hypothetical protein
MSAPNPANPCPKVNLVDLVDKDLPELAAFVASQSGKGCDETLAHLTWLLLENPARLELISLGCGARASNDALVGCVLYLPQMFVARQNPMLILGSSCFYVDESHRGSGGAIFLKFTRAANRSPLFGNSANAVAAQLWKARGANPIANSDHELLGVIHWPPVAEEIAARRGTAKSVARAIGAATAWLRSVRKLRLPANLESELVQLSSVERAAGLTRAEPSDSLTALRNERYIRWRYFSTTDPSIALFAFDDQRVQAPTFVAVNERARGHRAQIRALNVLDIFPKPQPDRILAIVAALQERYYNRTHMIVLRGLDEPSQKALIAAGFRRRDFESPNGWLFDPRGLVPTRQWYFVPADGDWII